ncbi:alpha/beta fold hydrolase [Trueperella bialowiezensis]|uniref:2-hydroxy-6-oxo-6-phenylhexa-2,4-dienoate hydrolase n=1 Tax=Trueperella bialowiezensis TaxID=312285 RepID=A0A448PFR3_9ACTO|nr:alpha/beta hydrolase [Trueperella bialowiezensis]VEI13772.1 2-hydroxy-6-oxo-6-phenylhexa-2,4-dienoate hydrolase [Trueperella bialowiezensis]
MIAYRRTGPKSDLPLVLLHALPLDSTMWDQVRQELGDLDVITFDAPGFGDSPRGEELSDAEPNMKTFVDAIKQRLDELGVLRIALGGLSMGGSVAADFTAAYPHMVAGLALMDTNITADDADRKAFRRSVAEMADRGEGYEAVKDWTTTMVGSAASDQVRESLDARFRALPNAGLAWIQRAMANREDRSDAVGLVKGPVYFIRGTEDPTASLESYMQLALRADQPRIKEIEGVGHFAADENPVELAKILRDFHADVVRADAIRH